MASFRINGRQRWIGDFYSLPRTPHYEGSKAQKAGMFNLPWTKINILLATCFLFFSISNAHLGFVPFKAV